MVFRFSARGLLLLTLLAVAPALFGGEYRGVAIGQRDDFLPPDFEPVLRGEYEARFGNEIMQVFVDGALVTGMKVWPQAPLNLAEGLARYSAGVSAADLRVLLDFNGDLLGVADVNREIAYFTHAVDPDAAVRSVGYYNDQTALMIFTAPVPQQESEDLITAARESSPDALERRPTVAGTAEQAKFLVQEATEKARPSAQYAASEMKRYAELCTGNATCDQERRTRAYFLVNAVSRFLDELRSAKHVYEVNSALLGHIAPQDLDDLQELSESLVKQLRDAVPGVTLTAPE